MKKNQNFTKKYTDHKTIVLRSVYCLVKFRFFIQELWERKSLQILYECWRRAYHALLAQLFILICEFRASTLSFCLKIFVFVKWITLSHMTCESSQDYLIYVHTIKVVKWITPSHKKCVKIRNSSICVHTIK
jgi:hypothetical protein